MIDIPLAEAQIIWNIHQREARADDPLVKVVRRGHDDPRYMASWGACNMEFNEASDEQRLSMLFAKFVALTIVYTTPPQAVHEAFMCIPEYRRGLADVGGLDPALVADERED